MLLAAKIDFSLSINKSSAAQRGRTWSQRVEVTVESDQLEVVVQQEVMAAARGDAPTLTRRSDADS